MRTKGLAISSLAAALLALAACEKKSAPAPAVPLDASLKVELPQELVSDRLLPVSYEIETGPAFQAPDCELTQFVHFVDENGKKLFQDDHEPEPPSSAWKAGQKLRMTRLLVLPVMEKDTPFQTLSGLYCVDQPGRQYSLQGTPWREGEQRYRLASGTVRPFVRPLSDELVGFEGWYGEEYDIPQRLSWRWMGKSAKLILANRGQDSLLYLEGRLPKAGGSDPVTLRLVLGGKPLGQAVTDAAGFLRTIYHLRPEDLGSESTAILELGVDRTFVPKAKGMGDDDRVLGLMMTKIHFGADTEATKGLEPRPHQAAYTAPPVEAGTAAPEATPAADAPPPAAAATPAAPGPAPAATP